MNRMGYISKRAKFPTSFGAILVLSIIALGTNSAIATEVPDEVARTHAAVNKHARDILKFAYPTAGALNGIAGTWDDRPSGYILDEKVDYDDSNGNAQSFTLRLRLNDSGAVTSISTIRQSEIWPPFGTGNLLLAIVKAAAQNDIDAARQANRPPPPGALLIVKATCIEDVIVVLVNVDR